MPSRLITTKSTFRTGSKTQECQYSRRLRVGSKTKCFTQEVHAYANPKMGHSGEAVSPQYCDYETMTCVGKTHNVQLAGVELSLRVNILSQ